MDALHRLLHGAGRGAASRDLPHRLRRLAAALRTLPSHPHALALPHRAAAARLLDGRGAPCRSFQQRHSWQRERRKQRRVPRAAAPSVTLSLLLTLSAHAGKFWCIYLTNWSLTCVCIHLTLSFFTSLYAHRSLQRAPAEAPPRPLWLPVLWSFQAIALPVSFLVMCLFWLLLGASFL